MTFWRLKGKFKFTELCNGTITLIVSHVGCETKEVSIVVNGDTFGTINLEHHLEELNEVVVKTNSKTEKTSVQKVVSKEVIEEYTDKSVVPHDANGAEWA